MDKRTTEREVIDEYGWRHFGDVWADHETAYYDGPRPVISHYNNQYDVLQGFLIQFLLSGDVRWWELGRIDSQGVDPGDPQAGPRQLDLRLRIAGP